MRAIPVSPESHCVFLFPQPTTPSFSSNSIAITHSFHPFHFKPHHSLSTPKPCSFKFRSLLYCASKSDPTTLEDDEVSEESLVEDGVCIEVMKLEKNSRRIQSRISIEAPLSAVWNILTDYERLADFVPGLAVSQLLQKGDTPIDLELTMKKIKKKQRKKTTSTELPEISIQTSTCLIEASPIDPAIPMDPCLAISTGPEQEMSKKKKKRKSKLESEAAELNEHYKLPEAAPPEAPVQKSIYHTDAPSIDPVGPSPPVDTETPIDQGQQMTKKKRKKKKRIVIIIEGTETNEHGVKPPETLVQKFAYPTVTTSIDPTIPVPAPPIDQGQKMRKKMRKRSALISKGAEPDEHDDKPPGTPVQRSIHPIAEPSIDPTIPASQTPPVDPATPVDPEPMTKKKRKKKRNSAKNEGLESEKHNADRIAETPVQKTEGSTTENSMGRCNVEPAGKTLVQITDTLRVTKSPFKHHGESSLRCRACRQPGHRFQQCQRLKCLSMDEEVCFFCGEIGHSLGKCDVSQAGGGRFAKCLLCYGHGHFSYNCPQNGHGIDPKVLAVNGAINRTVEARRELLPRFNM